MQISTSSGLVVVMNTFTPCNESEDWSDEETHRLAGKASQLLETHSSKWNFDVSKDCFVAWHVSRIIELVAVSISSIFVMRNAAITHATHHQLTFDNGRLMLGE